MQIREFIDHFQIPAIKAGFRDRMWSVLATVPYDDWIWMRDDLGDGCGCDTRGLEIWSPETPAVSPWQRLFLDLWPGLEQIPGAVNSYILYVSPHSQIPLHRDDDQELRLLTAVNQVDGAHLVMDNQEIRFDEDTWIGFQPNEVTHGGANPTDRYWVFFVVCLRSHPWQGQRLITR
jgi:hypothetical protein